VLWFHFGVCILDMEFSSTFPNTRWRKSFCLAEFNYSLQLLFSSLCLGRVSSVPWSRKVSSYSFSCFRKAAGIVHSRARRRLSGCEMSAAKRRKTGALPVTAKEPTGRSSNAVNENKYVLVYTDPSSEEGVFTWPLAQTSTVVGFGPGNCIL
jgi:hypothetical protein